MCQTYIQPDLYCIGHLDRWVKKYLKAWLVISIFRFHFVHLIHQLLINFLFFLLEFFLTLFAPCISESWIKIKVKLNFYFHSSLWCLHKTFWGTTRKYEYKNLVFSLCSGPGRVNNPILCHFLKWKFEEIYVFLSCFLDTLTTWIESKTANFTRVITASIYIVARYFYLT